MNNFKLLTVLGVLVLATSVFSAEDLAGRYQNDAYKEPQGTPKVTMTLESNKKFESYAEALKKDKKTNKEVYQTDLVAKGTWNLNGKSLVLKTKSGSCYYKYSDKTQGFGPETGRGFKFVSKSGKNTGFCKKLFLDEKAVAAE